MNKKIIEILEKQLIELAEDNDYLEFDEDMIIYDLIEILDKYKDFLGDEE